MLPRPAPYFQGFRQRWKSKLGVSNFSLSPNAFFFSTPSLLCPLATRFVFVFCASAETAALESRTWLSTEHLILPP